MHRRPEPPPRCRSCYDRIEYLDPTGDGLAAWWAHEHHPRDGHDAAPLRQWRKGDAAPDDATRFEISLHFMLEGSVLIPVPIRKESP